MMIWVGRATTCSVELAGLLIDRRPLLPEAGHRVSALLGELIKPSSREHALLFVTWA
jgi:hypothetical protein